MFFPLNSRIRGVTWCLLQSPKFTIRSGQFIVKSHIPNQSPAKQVKIPSGILFYRVIENTSDGHYTVFDRQLYTYSTKEEGGKINSCLSRDNIASNPYSKFIEPLSWLKKQEQQGNLTFYSSSSNKIHDFDKFNSLPLVPCRSIRKAHFALSIEVIDE